MWQVGSVPWDGAVLGWEAAIAETVEQFGTVLYGVEASAVIVAAFSGMLAARQHQLDFVGTYVLAFVTAFGGGTLRDLLLNRRPLFWVSHPEYPVIIFGLAILFVYCPWRWVPERPRARYLSDWVDAVGLALFSLSGTSFAIAQGLPNFAATIIGVITGVFGGVLRDVLLADIPRIFRTASSLYATCAFAGAWVYILVLQLGGLNATASVLGFLAAAGLRIASLHYDITLPQPRYGTERPLPPWGLQRSSRRRSRRRKKR
jgi:uncharacterized membrane protein YeiH